MDFKGIILFVGSLALENVNSVLTTSGLILNAVYIAYQIYNQHKKNGKE